jgi:RNA polymerase sigma-70 factor (ECF subfamily)
LVADEHDFDVVLAAAGRGDQWALAQLFRAYQPMLVRYLRGQVRDSADDLAGEVWLAVAGSLRGIEGGELGFRRWLFTIARRRVVDHRRRVARHRTDPTAGDALDGPDPKPLGVDPAVVVADRLAVQQAIDAVTADLTPDQAEAVLLRIVAGFDVAETARIMGRSPGSVRVLCHRALRRLAVRFPEGVLVE